MFCGSVKLKDNKTRRQNNRKKIQSLQSIDKTLLSIMLKLHHYFVINVTGIKFAFPTQVE